MGKFWIVWNENGRSPTVKHFTYDSAKNEAKRLARLNSNHSFHVLEQIGTAKKNDVSFFVHERPCDGVYAHDEYLFSKLGDGYEKQTN